LNNVSGSERDGGAVGNTGGELSEDGLGGDGEDCGVEELSVLEDLADSHFVFERSNLQFIEEGGLSGGDLISFGNNIEIVEDFNLGLDNLGSNTEVTEETSLSRIKTGGTGGDSDLLGGNGTDTGGGFSDLRVEDLEDVTEVVVGEDDGGVSLELSHNLIEVGHMGPVSVALFGVRSISGSGGSVELSDSFLHHGVLTTDELSSDGSHGSSHDADLLGGNVIGVNEHHLGVGRASILAFFPELVLSGLGFLIGTHYYFTSITVSFRIIEFRHLADTITYLIMY
jgi:hypothetical protein